MAYSGYRIMHYISRQSASLRFIRTYRQQLLALYEFCLIFHFCAFLVEFEDLLSLFFRPPSADFVSFIFIFIFSQLQVCIICIALLIGLAMVLTQGLYFCFCCFLFVFRKQICFGSEGVAKDKLVFGILKHGHVSFQILT